VPIWTDDLQLFAQVANQLVTAENKAYVVVFVGRAKRQGAGLCVEAGITAEQRIIDTFKDPSWRVKRIGMVFEGATLDRCTGVSGVVTQAALFFFKGSWTARIIPERRSFFGGSTWDDCWCGVPVLNREDWAPVPLGLKNEIFEVARSTIARGGSEGVQVDEEEALEEAGPDKGSPKGQGVGEAQQWEGGRGQQPQNGSRTAAWWKGTCGEKRRERRRTVD